MPKDKWIGKSRVTFTYGQTRQVSRNIFHNVKKITIKGKSAISECLQMKQLIFTIISKCHPIVLCNQIWMEPLGSYKKYQREIKLCILFTWLEDVTFIFSNKVLKKIKVLSLNISLES